MPIIYDDQSGATIIRKAAQARERQLNETIKRKDALITKLRAQVRELKERLARARA